MRPHAGDLGPGAAGRAGQPRRELAGEALRCANRLHARGERASAASLAQAAYMAKLKLPPTHREASEKALETLKASAGVNRE